MTLWGRLRRARPAPEPVAEEAATVRAIAGTVGLLTASLNCGTCHAQVQVDAASETVRHGPDREDPVRVTEAARAWILEWTCPACATPSSFTLPKLLPGFR